MANEELRAANEETQSSNEELQSTNESRGAAAPVDVRDVLGSHPGLRRAQPRPIVTQGRSLLLAACLLGMFGGIAARFWIARRLARAGRLRVALVADVFGPWVYFAALVVGTNLLQPGQEEWAPVTYLGIFIALGVFVAYLWPKLGRRRPVAPGS